MALYEQVVLTRPDISGQQAEALLEELKGILTEQGGSVSKIEYWGLRNLAYRIRKHRKAHYGLLNIDAEPMALHELERRMRIHDDVLRFMSIRVDEHEEAPSIQMQRGRDDRDDRRGHRGDRGPRGDRPRREDRAPRDESAAAGSSEGRG